MTADETPAAVCVQGEGTTTAAGTSAVSGRPAGVGTVVTDVDSVTTRTAKKRDDWKRSRCWTLTAQGSAVLAVPPELPADRYKVEAFAPILTAYSLTPVSSGLVEGDQQ